MKRITVILVFVLPATLFFLSACSMNQPSAGNDFPRPEPDYKEASVVGSGKKG